MFVSITFPRKFEEKVKFSDLFNELNGNSGIVCVASWMIDKDSGTCKIFVKIWSGWDSFPWLIE